MRFTLHRKSVVQDDEFEVLQCGHLGKGHSRREHAVAVHPRTERIIIDITGNRGRWGIMYKTDMND